MTPAPRVVLASRNEHKVAEIRRILQDAGAAVGLVGVAEFPDVGEVAETGLTFAENALLKARAVATATGLPALADDSGISVAALNGMPGVFSARWSGQHGDDAANLELLLGQLREVPDEHRDAAFVCAAAFVIPGDDGGAAGTAEATGGGTEATDGAPPVAEIVEEGQIAGRLVRSARGAGGFGYDPIFVPDGDTRTTAEMTPEEKNAVSHRGRAFRAIAPRIVEALG